MGNFYCLSYLIAWVLNLLIMLLLARKGKRICFQKVFCLSFFIPSFKNFKRQKNTNFRQFEVSLFYIVNSRLDYTVGTDSEKC